MNCGKINSMRIMVFDHPINFAGIEFSEKLENLIETLYQNNLVPIFYQV